LLLGGLLDVANGDPALGTAALEIVEVDTQL
jgi:hypothetical protein